MNLINLKKMYNHILLNVPENMIIMKFYRTGKKDIHKCGSTGCVIGHCVILDDWENVRKDYEGSINFELWSENFTGLYSMSNLWYWCFSSNWPNNKEQILLRLKYLIENQKIPKEWRFNRNYEYLLPIKNLEPYELN